MSEGADSTTQISESSVTTLKAETKSDESSQTTTTTTTPTYSGRRPRFGTGSIPASPFIWVDGKQIRSALAWTKKQPPRRVSFPTNDTHLVTGYLEPANPWKHAENVNQDDLISAYKDSCSKHNTTPLENVVAQLEKLDVLDERCEEFSLKGVTLDQQHCESLEEIFKRVQFKRIDLEATSLDDESAVILFDMLEYYESTKHLNVSANQNIGLRGWQACSHMIKKTQCLEQLEARDVILNESIMNILSRAIRLVCHLNVLKLENCGLSGRSIVMLVNSLKLNTGIRELYLADNGLDFYDAIQLGSLLRINNHLQLLDISNNNIQDEGVRDMLDGLINQVSDDKEGKGLSILILWNNRLTQKASPHLARIITFSKTLETLNIGKNSLTSETLVVIKDALIKNRTLLQLGMQSTDLTCYGILALVEVMENNEVLQRIDLRDNGIQMRGMKALMDAIIKNKYITQLDLDDKPRERIDGSLRQYMDLVAEIRDCCARNEKNRPSNESTEDLESPQHQSRYCSASSRKISLTCQTLPCSPPPMASIRPEDGGRSMLEPKRSSGGRLRSPAPSPIPSPVASPVPSPSRNRFVVSRVPETSLSSTSSSASSSPITPPSFGSLSNFFPSTSSRSSRFRVSIVEPAFSASSSSSASPKPVVSSSKSNVTIGFDYKVDDTADPDGLVKPEVKVTDDRKNTGSVEAFSVEPGQQGNSTKSLNDIVKNDEHEASVNDRDKFEDHADPGNSNSTLDRSIKCRELEESSAISMEVFEDRTEEKISSVAQDSTEKLSRSIKRQEKELGSSTISMEVRECNNEEKTQSAAQDSTKDNAIAQRQNSNLKKLLALFQRPNHFLSEATSIAQSELRIAVNENVNNVLVLGDKVHQYFKDEKENSWTKDKEQSRSIQTQQQTARTIDVSHAAATSSLTGMINSLKMDLTVPSHNPKTRTDDHETRTEASFDNQSIKPDEDSAPIVNNQSLPENVQSIDERERSSNDTLRAHSDACSKFVNNAPTNNVPENKRTVCVPKLNDIPEYSVLELSESGHKVGETESEASVGYTDSSVGNICDRTIPSDSINLTSDNFSATNANCDNLEVVDNVNIVGRLDYVNLNDDEIGLDLTRADCRGSSVGALGGSAVDMENFEMNLGEVTNIRRDDEESEHRVPNQTKSEETCHRHDITHIDSTIVNKINIESAEFADNHCPGRESRDEEFKVKATDKGNEQEMEVLSNSKINNLESKVEDKFHGEEITIEMDSEHETNKLESMIEDEVQDKEIIIEKDSDHETNNMEPEMEDEIQGTETTTEMDSDRDSNKIGSKIETEIHDDLVTTMMASDRVLVEGDSARVNTTTEADELTTEIVSKPDIIDMDSKVETEILDRNITFDMISDLETDRRKESKDQSNEESTEMVCDKLESKMEAEILDENISLDMISDSETDRRKELKDQGNEESTEMISEKLESKVESEVQDDTIPVDKDFESEMGRLEISKDQGDDEATGKICNLETSKGEIAIEIPTESQRDDQNEGEETVDFCGKAMERPSMNSLQSTTRMARGRRIFYRLPCRRRASRWRSPRYIGIVKIRGSRRPCPPTTRSLGRIGGNRGTASRRV
ncbi:uncharacterized protein [Prorops nasuta]|uniref:uncharacterized protein isoform X2 n=1 Tax=Prorops nasuta TaxID=863751 RepID=UPI0034CD432E